MWFCYRGGIEFRNAARGYRIGYAWSHDGTTWHRDDEAGALQPSGDGWDSEMVCYPCVLNIDRKISMFYSGNYFGRDGFGYAVARDIPPSRQPMEDTTQAQTRAVTGVHPPDMWGNSVLRKRPSRSPRRGVGIVRD